MPALLARPVRLTIDEYRLACEAANVSTMHWNLAPPGTPELDPAESAALRAQAWEGLQRKGVVEGQVVSEDVIDTLRILTNSTVEVHAQLARDGRVSACLVAAGVHDHAVLAVLDEGGLDLQSLRPEDLVRAVAAQIATAPAAPGRPVAVVAELLAPGQGLAPEEIDRRLTRAGIPRQEIQALHALCDGSRVSSATVGVARHSRPAELALTWAQTERGGIAFDFHHRPDGRLWCAVTPCDAVHLARLITRHLDAVPHQ